MKKERRRNRELRRAQRRQARIDAGLVPSTRDTPKKKVSETISRNILKDKFSTSGKLLLISYSKIKGEEEKEGVLLVPLI